MECVLTNHNIRDDQRISTVHNSTIKGIEPLDNYTSRIVIIYVMSVCVYVGLSVRLCQLYSLNGWAEFDEISQK